MQISHRTIQHVIKKALAPHKVWLEKRFSNIKRVADVVWPAKKIIFEIQCSPISVREVQLRNRDYQKLGYSVVWILHDCCFNRTHITLTEYFLRSKSHYFTNINSLGHGEIYDQDAHIYHSQRVKRSARYPIAIHQPIYLKQIARHLPSDRQKWALSFHGDLFHRANQFLKRPSFSLYRFIFQSLLKKSLSAQDE